MTKPVEVGGVLFLSCWTCCNLSGLGTDCYCTLIPSLTECSREFLGGILENSTFLCLHIVIDSEVQVNSDIVTTRRNSSQK